MSDPHVFGPLLGILQDAKWMFLLAEAFLGAQFNAWGS